MENQKMYKSININTDKEFLNIVVHTRSVYEHYITDYEHTALVDIKLLTAKHLQ